MPEPVDGKSNEHYYGDWMWDENGNHTEPYTQLVELIKCALTESGVSSVHARNLAETIIPMLATAGLAPEGELDPLVLGRYGLQKMRPRRV